MSYQVLARKWRPQSFSTVVGQATVVQALENALAMQKLHHAYLFVGIRGVGKTTLARLFAKALNCEQGVSANPCNECNACRSIMGGHFVDLIEIDAASKTGVNDTREILENTQYATTTGRYKVYLIDEIHMFSNASFNALLKTLEEPPEHVKFLLATTDPQKLPVTILSRCLQLRLQSVDEETLTDHFAHILATDQIAVDDPSALSLLAKASDGSVRDGLSLLDHAIALGSGQITLADVQTMLGAVESVQLAKLLTAVLNKDVAQTLDQSRRMAQQSSHLQYTLTGLIEWVHQLAMVKYLGEDANQHARITDIDTLTSLSQTISAEEIQLLYDLLLRGQNDLNIAPNKREAFEMLMLRLIAFRPVDATEAPQPTSQQSRPVPAAVSAQKPAPIKPPKPPHSSPVESPQNMESGTSAIQSPDAESLKAETPPPSPIEPPKPPHSSPVESPPNVKSGTSVAQSPDADSLKPATPPQAPMTEVANPFEKTPWNQWLSQKREHFSNIVWQYLRNSQFNQFSDEVLVIGLGQSHFNMCQNQQKQQLIDQVKSAFGRSIQVEIEAANEVTNSVKHSQLDQANAQMASDTVLQDLKNNLDLNLIEGSIKLKN